jgi:hypothetical protein
MYNWKPETLVPLGNRIPKPQKLGRTGRKVAGTLALAFINKYVKHIYSFVLLQVAFRLTIYLNLDILVFWLQACVTRFFNSFLGMMTTKFKPTS